MSQKKTGNTATYLLTKQTDQLPDINRVKVVIVGVDVAVTIAILFKRLATELVLIDTNEKLAKETAEDISHAGGCLGNPKIVGTKDYSAARDAAVCVITTGGKQHDDQQQSTLLNQNFDLFKYIIPNVCKYAPNCILIIVSKPVDILSFAAMKLSGFPPNRVIGLGTFLDSCKFQYYISEQLGVSPSSIQALVIGENSSNSVPVWSAVSLMGVKLKDINKDIGNKIDPEGWNIIHDKVINIDDELIKNKGYPSWGVGICVGEIVDAVIRNTCVCMTVSTYIKGCKHGYEKDIFMSLPCIIGKNGVQSKIRHPYTDEEQSKLIKSSKSIYELQKTILDQLE
ncbi:L-lactate dehydrogenase B chain-like [Aphidius gifuensis]|uniref:L-lactate dehydrogenase B chain-like n=1 Tax=Aphidius gifuensis TaxID=684658 RepID=UPI001CDD3C9A|nr:L-lactate dehydrogenase B chain-like [Aphidius gifuensis]